MICLKMIKKTDKMVRKSMLLFALFIFGISNAQIGIGTEIPQSSSQLEVASINKGVLFPRVTLTSLDSANPIVGKLVNSLLVYNIGSESIIEGFYYWYNGKWVRLVDGETILADTSNSSFTLVEGELKITDSKGDSVVLPVSEIAENEYFVSSLNQNEAFDKVVKGKETVTTIVREKNPEGVEISGKYEYYNESGAVQAVIDVAQDVIDNSEKIFSNESVQKEVNTIVSGMVSSVVNYSYDEQVTGKHWVDDEEVATRVFDITLNAATNTVEVPMVVSGTILEAKLINQMTNSISEGVVNKAVRGGNTVITLGTPGSFTVYHPADRYFLILEYTKKGI